MSTPNTPRPAGGTGGTRPAPPRQAPVGAQRPAGAPRPGTAPKPSAAQRPAGAPRPGAPRPGAPRPAGAAQGRPQQLVRPAPKAKVRKARLLISKVDPWSVLKMAFLLSVALGIVTVVASVVLWSVLDLTGIFEAINGLLREIIGSETGFDLMEIASLGQVASFATIIAVVNVVLLTALSMLSAVLYNLSSTLVGGIGVTLTDD
ncbi:DUF3566 domain-containing protein [Paeniglutamicibacter sp. ZC-3]|uniref:DUF3566 domain-containing protein n=1 Tax=Paeniglutamicibacter TaxID=1742990 RepID=UPI0021F6C6F7|nr:MULTISPECIES: DUF3566 domain-containing protein [Paeniglutamicibacter]MCV9995774.1 DUF3566 domain-containing protein [Paeniglutamicibacter sp. ZC-3]MDO2933963.1 DUF3566 domain-containing protein [Paeniglutamicibacter sulfureus]